MNTRSAKRLSSNTFRSTFPQSTAIIFSILLISGTVVGAIGYRGMPQNAFAQTGASITASTDPHADKFFGPALAQIRISDPALAADNAQNIASVSISGTGPSGGSGSVIFNATETSGTSGTLLIYLKVDMTEGTLDQPAQPSNPLSNTYSLVYVHHTNQDPGYGTGLPAGAQLVDLMGSVNMGLDGATFTVTYGSASKSITYGSTTATLTIDRTVYGPGNTIYAQIYDPDMNLDPTSINTITESSARQLLNGTDISGLPLTFTETGTNTAQFETTLAVSGGSLPEGRTLTANDYKDYVGGASSTVQVAGSALILNISSASYTVQVAPGTIQGIPSSLTYSSELPFSVVDSDANADSTLRDNGMVVAKVDGTDVGAYSIRETGSNTAVFNPDYSNDRIKLTFKQQTNPSSGILNVKPGQQIELVYLDANPSGNVTSSTLMVNYVAPSLSPNSGSVGPTSVVSLTLVDPEFNDDPLTADSYTISYSAGQNTSHANGIVSFPTGNAFSFEIARNGSPLTLTSAFSLTFTETGGNTGIFGASLNLGTLDSASPSNFATGDIFKLEIKDLLFSGASPKFALIGIAPAITIRSITCDTPGCTGPFSPREGIDAITVNANLFISNAGTYTTLFEARNSTGDVVVSSFSSGSYPASSVNGVGFGVSPFSAPGDYKLRVTLLSGSTTLATYDEPNVVHVQSTGSSDTTPPTISAISDSPDPFSPNGDSIKDDTTITFTSDEAGFYTIMILTPSNGPVQNLTGAMVAGVNNAVWDGLKYDTTAALDGVYKYIITAQDAASNLRSAPGGIDGIITLDTTALPTPLILNPGNGTSTSDNTPLINGTVAANFLAKFGNGNYQGIALDPNAGVIYVTNLSVVEKYSLDGTLLTQWGSSGSGDGQFALAVDVAVDSLGYVYVADRDNDRIQKFDSDGNFITKWGTSVFSGGQFYFPTGVAVGPGDIVYVVQTNADTITTFTSSGVPELSIGTQGTGDGQLRNPSDVAVDSAGYVYVTDTNNNRVQKFDSFGNYVTQWGSAGSGDGQFLLASGIEYDPTTDLVFVGDRYNGNIQIFDTDGNFVAKFGSHAPLCTLNPAVYCPEDGQLVGFGADAAIDPETGKIYVVDGTRIQVFEPDYGQASVEIFDGATLLATLTTDPSTTWSFTPSTPLADGLHILRVRVADAAGNASPPNGHIEFTVNTSSGGGSAAEKIVFTSNRDGTNNNEIYIMNADGTGQTRLTNNGAVDEQPSLSPDGTKIVFASDRDFTGPGTTTPRAIYVMNADGTGQTKLTDIATNDNEPAWSPDGTKIAFTSTRDGHEEIYIMNADGTGQTRLTTGSGGHRFMPSWSPDGTRIAFVDSKDIFVINVDGSGLTFLPNPNHYNEADPKFSPDSSKIAFAVTNGGGGIFVMNADGTSQTQLTNAGPPYDRYPSWSPDGSKIAFASHRDGNDEIYIMNADGTGQTNLSNNSADDFYPSWPVAPTLGLSITLALDKATAAWGEDVLASVTVLGAQAGDYVVVDQGNGVTFTYPAFTGSFGGTLDPTTLVYDSSGVGITFPVTATLYDSSDNPIATSNAPSVATGPRPTTLTLHLPVSVVNGTIFTASGELADGLTGQGLAGKTITFNTLLGIPLGAATTAGINVQDAGGIDIVSCDVPQCTADNPNANSVNLLKLHSGATMSLPPGVTAAAFTLQDIDGGTVTVRVTRSDASTFDATSDPAGLGLATFVLSARDATHPNQYLQSIEVISATGGLFGTSKIELYDADADPTTLVLATFDYYAAQSYGTTLTISSGSYFSSALAPVLVLPDIPVSAHFIGDSLYSAADTPDQSFATELGLELDNSGIGGTVAVYANANPNFTTISCSAQDSDSDGDGLCNSWETGSGIPYACATGTCYYVLPATTVPVTNTPQTTSQNHKDIFIEIDAMDGQAPLDGALKRVIDAFAAAPVTNPDGTTGITLHIIKDEMNLPFVGKLDNRAPVGSTHLFNAWVDPVTGGDNGDKTDDYFGIKSQHYGTTDQERSDSALKNARANAVRYNLWVSTIGDSTTSGLAEDFGNDMIVSLGNFGGTLNQYGSMTGTETEQAGAFMHEAGHLLNLKHGGPAEIVASISGTQNDVATLSSGGALGNYPRTTTLSGYTVSTMGPGSSTIRLQQVVKLTAGSTSVNALTVTPSSTTDTRLGTPTISLDAASTSAKKVFNINYPLSTPYMDPTQGIDYAVDLGTPNKSKYMQVENSDYHVYDVGTEDFWLAGMFMRTYDSGGNEVIVEKKSGTTSINSGYAVYVSGTDKLTARIAAGVTSVAAAPTTTVELNKWYAWAVSFDRDTQNGMTVYLYDVAAGTLSTVSTDPTSQSASITNTQTFTVGRRTNLGSLYFSGQMDNLITPQIGQTLPTLTANDFSNFVSTRTIAGTAVKYNFNSWDASAAVVDAAGANQLTAFPSNQQPAFIPDTTVPMVDSSVTQITIPTLTVNFKLSSNVNIASFATPTYPTLTRIIPEDISTNCKPNYESIMSYARELPRYLNENGEFALDYSRGNYAPLNENNLDESRGVFSRDALNVPHNAIIWGSPSGLISTIPGTMQVQKGYSYGPGQNPTLIDWSADGSFSTVQANILNLSIDGCNPADLTPTTLHDYSDWNNIKLNWKQNALGTFDGVTRAATKAATELTEETDEQMKAQVTSVQVDTLTDDRIYYGESVSITGSSTNAPENSILLIDWGDGTSEQFEGAVDPATGAWPVEGIVLSHTYGSDGVGERRITASLLDGSHEAMATSSGTTILVQDVTAPILSLPADFVVEAVSPDGAPVTYEATGEDEVDGLLDVVCTPESGSTLPLGIMVVECSATDANGNVGSSSFTVEVQDKTPPTITAADISVQATGAQTPVTFTVTAIDLVDGDVEVECDATSGSGFSVGTHSVHCSATDSHENTADSSFTISVVPTRPAPTITTSDIVAEATGPTGAIVLFEVSATDTVDGTLPVSCDYTSGSIFPLGTTVVHCSATNSEGVSSASSFNIVVQDTIPPAITVSADITDLPTNPSGATVTYVATANDLVDGSIAPLCTPASGSTFAIGTTTITCTATDAHGNIGSATFHVTVLTQSQAIKSLADLVDSMNLDKGTTTSLKSKLDAAYQALAKGDKTTSKNLLSAFINEVNAQTGKKITNAQASQLISVAQNTIRAIG